MSENNFIVNHIFQFLVVGAGISGLQSLQILTRSTKNVLCLESQSQPAGRVFTQSIVSLPGADKIDWIKKNSANLKNVFIEKGATWVEQRHKYLLQICKNFGLELREQNTEGDNIYLFKDKPLSTKQLMNDPRFGPELKIFVKKIDQLARLYDKYVLTPNSKKLRANRMLAQNDTKTVIEFLEQSIGTPEARELAQNFLQHTECVSCEQNSMHEVLVKTARSNDIGILREFLGDYSDDGHEGSYILNEGTYSVMRKFIEAIEKNTGKKIGDTILFNQKVMTIDNEIDSFCTITTLNSVTNKVNHYRSKKIICTIPLAVSRTITFKNISKAKRLILDNQLRTSCLKSFLITKKPFWRRSASGDCIFSDEYLVNMCHDISPNDLSCGIMVFFHNGRKFDAWESKFKAQQNQYEAKRKYIIDLVYKLFQVTQAEKKQYLDQSLFYISSFMDNPHIRSGFQSCTSPGTFTSILKFGEGIQAFYRDENNVYFVGSEYSSQFASYMEGAIRVAREKCFKLIGQQDDLFAKDQNLVKQNTAMSLKSIKPRL